MLASGVRSSCDASATSCRWAPTERLEGLQGRVEGARQAAELVVALHGQPAAEHVGAGDLLGARGERATGASAAPETARPAQPPGDAADGDRERGPRSARAGRVDLVQRAGHRTRLPAERGGEDAQMVAVDRGVAESSLRRAATAGSRRRPAGWRRVLRAAMTSASGSDELDQAARLHRTQLRRSGRRPGTAEGATWAGPAARAADLDRELLDARLALRSDESTSPRSFARTGT